MARYEFDFEGLDELKEDMERLLDEYPDETEKDVLVYQGRQFEINAILNLMESNTYLEIYCTESKDKVIEEA